MNLGGKDVIKNSRINKETTIMNESRELIPDKAEPISIKTSKLINPIII